MKHTIVITRKDHYHRPDDVRDVLPPEYVHRFLALGYDFHYLDDLFWSSVRQAEYAHKEDKYLDYYRMNLIADIKESEQLIKEDKENE